MSINPLDKEMTTILHGPRISNSPGISNYPEIPKDLELSAKILLIGDSGVGKTSLMENLARSRQNKSRQGHYTSPTIGVDFKIIRSTIPMALKILNPILEPFNEIKYRMWDASGSERFHPIITNYYRNIDALVVICDLCDRRTFQRIDKWLQDFDEYSDREWSKIVTILVANKSDLVVDHQVTVEEISQLAEKLGVSYIITCANDYSPEKIIDQLNLQLLDKNYQYMIDNCLDLINHYQKVTKTSKIKNHRQCCQIL